MLLPALNKARSTAKAVSCKNTMKQIGITYQLYASDSEDLVCPARLSENKKQVNWFEKLGFYAPELFKRRYKEKTYLFNSFAVPPCSEYALGQQTYDTVEGEKNNGNFGGIAANRHFGFQNDSGAWAGNTGLYKFSRVKNPTKVFVLGEGHYGALAKENADWMGAWRSARFPHPDGMSLMYADSHIGNFKQFAPTWTGMMMLTWYPDGSDAH